MKKIMFNDKYGLTEAVLNGRKTMTRRIVLAQYVPLIEDGLQGAALIEAQRHGDAYRENEIVAVAQPYKVLNYSFYGFATNPSRSCGIRKGYAEKQKGWGNKMFVESRVMPHQVRITDIKIERLQDISDIDCAKEGVRYFLDYGQERIARFYIDAIPNYRPGKMITYDCVKDAFAALIDKVSGKGTWERNPFVFAYSFELVK